MAAGNWIEERKDSKRGLTKKLSWILKGIGV